MKHGRREYSGLSYKRGKVSKLLEKKEKADAKIKLGISGWVEREGNKRIVRPLQESRSLMIAFTLEV